MVRIMLLPAACLALTGAAAAAVGPAALPAGGTGLVRARAEPAGTVPGRMRLRGVEPESTGAIPAPSARPPCPPGRRVGTGTGFCLIN
jgi:hypothetical protein